MPASRTKFYLDTRNAKYKGVCAGMADYTGIDVTWIRLGMLILALPTHLFLVFAYFITAWVAQPKPSGLYQDEGDSKFWQGVRSNPTRSTAEVRSKFRELDRRLADIELHYTSRNTTLANEIDSLR